MHPGEDPARVDPQRLLAEADWLERMALALVRDPNAADDLVQDTWVVALTRPPRHAGNLRGWLARVARNLWSGASRDELRRRDREGLSAAARVPDPGLELERRLHLQRRLVDALLALDAPYRAAVALRYLDDLPVKEIAAREGISEANARQRISRGLAQLRVHLDAESGGDREPWSLALLAWLGSRRPPAPVVAAASKSFATPVLAMAVSKKAVSAAVLALCLAASWLTWKSARPEPAPPPLGEVPAAIPVSRPDARPAVLAPPEPAPVRVARADEAAAQPRPPMLAVAVRTVDERDAPLAMCTVEVREVPPGKGGRRGHTQIQYPDADPGELLGRALSDASGACTVEVPLGTPLVSSSAMSPDGRSSGTVLGELADAPDGVITLRLLPRIKLRGLVRDTIARPVAGATVRVESAGILLGRGAATQLPQPVLSGADGRFEILLDGVHASLRVVAGFERQQSAPVFVQTASPPSDEIVLEVPLHPNDAYAIEGIVSDPSGARAAGASVWVHGLDFAHFGGTTADERGQFRLVVEHAGEFLLNARAAHGAVAHPPIVTVDEGHPRARVELSIEPWSTVRGRVVWKSGAAAAGVTVAAYPTACLDHAERRASDVLAENLGSTKVTTGPDGAFELREVPRGYRSSVFAYPEARSDIAVGIEDVLAGRDDLVLVLDESLLEGGCVAVDAFDTHTGLAVTQYRVRIFARDASGAWLEDTQRGLLFAAPDGRFALDALTRGREYFLAVEADPFDRVLLGPWRALGGRETFRAEVGIDGELAVRPRHADGSKARGWQIEVREKGSYPPRDQRPLVAGGEACELRIRPLRAGSYEVTARRADRVVGPLTIAVEPDQARALELTVPED